RFPRGSTSARTGAGSGGGNESGSNGTRGGDDRGGPGRLWEFGGRHRFRRASDIRGGERRMRPRFRVHRGARRRQRAADAKRGAGRGRRIVRGHRVRSVGTRHATNRGGTNGPHPSTRRNTRGHVGRDPGHVVISSGQRYVGDPRTGLGNARDEAGESIAAESRKRGGPSATGRA